MAASRSPGSAGETGGLPGRVVGLGRGVRPPLARGPRGAGPLDRGAAVVDFVLVLVVLVPVFLGILQIAVVMLVHNTLASAASEGARYAATLDRGPADGVARTRAQIDGALAGRFARNVTARPAVVGGAPGVEVVVRATVPALGIGGPAVELTVTGHAVEEQRP